MVKKFKSRLPLWLLMIAFGSTIVNAYFGFVRMGSESVGPTVEFVGSIIAMAVFGFGIRNRFYRSVLEIGDDFISYGNSFQGFMWRAKLSDVAEVVPNREGKVVLRMTAGRERKISLFEIAKADRDAVRQAITDAVVRCSD